MDNRRVPQGLNLDPLCFILKMLGVLHGVAVRVFNAAVLSFSYGPRRTFAACLPLLLSFFFLKYSLWNKGHYGHKNSQKKYTVQAKSLDTFSFSEFSLFP